ncbi:MAG: CoA ester lyase [Dehalococcoidia bacterium]
MTRPTRLRRSELSTPGSNPKMIERAAAGDADLVFLDLEDAVSPNEKVPSRKFIVEGLNNLDWGKKTRAVRINGTHTHWCYEDLVEVVTGAGKNLDVIIVPKPKSPRDVWFVDTLLTQLENQLGLEEGKIGLELLIEETEALARVEEIAACSPRLEALILGFGDFSASQGMRLSLHGKGEGKYPGDPWSYHRNRMIVAAKANGLDAIDGPFADFRDDEGYRREATWASALGAVGKWAIHPSQVPIANDVYSPTDSEIARAQKVIAQVREAEAAGTGAANAGGVMIDAATARLYEVTLERARQTGKI